MTTTTKGTYDEPPLDMKARRRIRYRDTAKMTGTVTKLAALKAHCVDDEGMRRKGRQEK